MAKKTRRTSTEYDDSDLFADDESDVDEFIDDKDGEPRHRKNQRKQALSARQKIEDRMDTLRLRSDVQDWDDFDLDDRIR